MPGTDLPETAAVAVGVLCRQDGRVLLARRPPGRPAAGYWEFPGGKAEPGEPLAQALARELREELGIGYATPRPGWIFPCRGRAAGAPAFFRVGSWHGEPRGREGQQLCWALPQDPQVSPLLPFNDHVLRALTLPGRYAITAAEALGVAGFLPRLEAALARGVRLIQVREPGMSRPELLVFAREVIARAHPAGARVLVNGDVELAGKRVPTECICARDS